MATNASNTTPHFGLSQWEGSDPIRREDFNADHAAIDAALHAQEQAMTLVKLFETTVTEDITGITIDLSGVDLSRYMKLTLQGILPPTATSNKYCYLRINGNETAGDYGAGLFVYNAEGKLEGAVYDYDSITLGEAHPNTNGGTFFEEVLCDTGTHLVCIPSGWAANLDEDVGGLGAVAQERSRPTIWRNGSLAEVETLLVYYGRPGGTVLSIPLGTRFLLSGWRA